MKTIRHNIPNRQFDKAPNPGPLSYYCPRGQVSPKSTLPHYPHSDVYGLPSSLEFVDVCVCEYVLTGGTYYSIHHGTFPPHVACKS